MLIYPPVFTSALEWLECAWEKVRAHSDSCEWIATAVGWRCPSAPLHQGVRNFLWNDSTQPAQQIKSRREISLMYSVAVGKEALHVDMEDMRLSKLVASCLELNKNEVKVIADMVGDADEFDQNPAVFSRILKQTIRDHRLEHLFCCGAAGEHHRGIGSTPILASRQFELQAGVAQLVECNLAKVEVESSRLFSRSSM
jgi:hypothetical protein